MVTHTPAKDIRTVTVDTRDLAGYADIDLYHTGYTNGTDTGMEDGIIQEYNATHDTAYTYDDFEWHHDIDAALHDIAQFVATRITSTPAVRTATIRDVRSPHEYNYTGDHATLTITYDANAAQQYVDAHIQGYVHFLVTSGWQDVIETHILDERYYNAELEGAADNDDTYAARYNREKAQRAQEERINAQYAAQLDFYLTHNIEGYTPDDIDYDLYQAKEDAIYDHTTYTPPHTSNNNHNEGE